MIGTTLECIGFLFQQTEGKWEVTEYHEKRSLNANALYWQCVTQLAKAMRVSNAYIHNRMLIKYGSHWLVDGQEVWVALPNTDKALHDAEEDTNTHLEPTDELTSSKKRRWYIMLKPSHEFDTSEMSRLIDGIAYEMRYAELVPPQDEQIAKALERYEKREKE